MTRRRPPRRALATPGVLALVLLAGCGSDGSPTTIDAPPSAVDARPSTDDGSATTRATTPVRGPGFRTVVPEGWVDRLAQRRHEAEGAVLQYESPEPEAGTQDSVSVVRLPSAGPGTDTQKLDAATADVRASFTQESVAPPETHATTLAGEPARSVTVTKDETGRAVLRAVVALHGRYTYLVFVGTSEGIRATGARIQADVVRAWRWD